jgi:hypothetical protein
MKTSEAKDKVLDYLVAKCEGLKDFDIENLCFYDDEGIPFEPSCVWSQGGPIIERERIAIWFEKYDDIDSALPVWAAVRFNEQDYYGSTPLIAAMRCYVASKLGDDVEVPVELTTEEV